MAIAGQALGLANLRINYYLTVKGWIPDNRQLQGQQIVVAFKPEGTVSLSLRYVHFCFQSVGISHV